MPYKIMHNSGQCPGDKKFAVVKEADDKLMGCHATKEEAKKHMAALYASEEGGNGMSETTYLIDLNSSGFAFADDNSTSTWVHALPLGSYKHPIFGTIDITTERVKRFVANVVNKVRGIEPSINKMHANSGDGEAVGWVKNAEARSDGLWLLVDFVKETVADIKDKKWRYFSAEYVDKWTDQNGVEHSDVVLGGALTNRPFMKNLIPINLSEHVSDSMFDFASIVSGISVDSLKGGNTTVALSEEDLKKIIEGVAEKVNPAKSAPTVEPTTKLTDIPELKSLAEENPIVALLIKQVEAQNENLAKSAIDLKEKDIIAKLAEFDRSKIVLTPVARKLATELMMALPVELSEQFWQLMTEMKRGSSFLVEIGERAGATVNYGAPKSAMKQFNEVIDGLRKADSKLSYTDAVERAAADNPALYKRYRNEQYEGVTN